MSCYEALASSYDALTEDVGYEKRADFLEKLFRRSRIPVKVVLDLACGTGTMTWLLTGRGYELIGVDGSEEMLAAAMSKGGTVQGVPPIFLHQSMPQLDLYGTVDAAICCLDSLNYLTDPADVRRTFRRLHLFVAPGGVLVFDVNTVAKLAALDGQVFLDETEDTYCVWRTRRVSQVTLYLLHGSVPASRRQGLGSAGGAAPRAGLHCGGADGVAHRGRLRRHPCLWRRQAAPSAGGRAAGVFLLHTKLNERG